MSVYLAVDAGGTKTECVIADDERVLARVTGETVKIMLWVRLKLRRACAYRWKRPARIAKVCRCTW